jgi:murein L,D-transpeptidase YafK
MNIYIYMHIYIYRHMYGRIAFCMFPNQRDSTKKNHGYKIYPMIH